MSLFATIMGNASAAPTLSIVGDDGADGEGNWPTSEDRGVFAPFELEVTATLVSFNMRTRGGSTSGNRYKGLVYAADGPSGLPGTLLATSTPSDVIGAGVQLISTPIAGVITPQTIWIGYMCDGGSGSGAETDSGGTNAGLTIMFNGVGGMSYASPGNPAPEWPGSPGPYANVPSAWLVHS